MEAAARQAHGVTQPGRIALTGGPRHVGGCRLVQCRQEERAPSAGTIRSIESTTRNTDSPGTRPVNSSGGRMLLATAPGSNGTGGTRTSAVRTPISRASRSAAGRDHENFATNRSLMTALDECDSGSLSPHFSSSRRSPSGPIADAKSAATTRPRAADPTCGNSSPQGRTYRGE